MDLKAGVTLIPPPIKNFSCMHPRLAGHSLIYYVGFIEIIETFLILILTIGVIGANALIIFVINHRRYTSYIPQQPRYLLTSLALNDLAIGLLITPFGLAPALFKCWPYGEIFCQIQSLLRGALSQQSAVILICMAIDRYMLALHPRRYHQHSSKKGCVAILSLTWIINLTVFGLLVLPRGYYFNNTGLMACEPFYSKPSYRILATCALYFPTTMVLMYCYGLSFHLSRFRLVTEPTQPITVTSQTSLNATMKKMTLEERHLNASTSRSMAAISLGFIVMVTPWTIQEIVTACTGSKLPRFLDFLVTWTALSNSFWNPFLYWLLNSHFRRLSRFLLSIQRCPHEDMPRHKGHCCNINTTNEYDPFSTILPFPPPPPGSHHHHHHHFHHTEMRRQQQTSSSSPIPPLQSNISPYYLTTTNIRSDVEGLSEKYWGEILERTLSSGSLYALQKSFSKNHLQQQSTLDNQKQFDNIKEQQKQQQQSVNFSTSTDLISSVTQCEQHISKNNSNKDDNEENIDCGNEETIEDDDDDDDNGIGGHKEQNDDEADEIDDMEGDDEQPQYHSHCHQSKSYHYQQEQQQQQQQHKKHLHCSNQETRLCEHIYHDVNCAKNRAVFDTNSPTL